MSGAAGARRTSPNIKVNDEDGGVHELPLPTDVTKSFQGVAITPTSMLHVVEHQTHTCHHTAWSWWSRQ
jgi:hypothetical protein